MKHSLDLHLPLWAMIRDALEESYIKVLRPILGKCTYKQSWKIHNSSWPAKFILALTMVDMLLYKKPSIFRPRACSILVISFWVICEIFIIIRGWIEKKKKTLFKNSSLISKMIFPCGQRPKIMARSKVLVLSS